MDASRFDDLLRTLTRGSSRRTLPRLAGIVVALGFAGRTTGGVTAKKRRKRKKVKRNGLGCVNVGRFCKRANQCCSGICKGKKGKKKCTGHDAQGCEAGQTVAACGGTTVACTSSAGLPGVCQTTTGRAAYCSAIATGCVGCRRDGECAALCGAGAACIPCAAFCGAGGTVCACLSP